MSDFAIAFFTFTNVKYDQRSARKRFANYLSRLKGGKEVI